MELNTYKEIEYLLSRDDFVPSVIEVYDAMHSKYAYCLAMHLLHNLRVNGDINLLNPLTGEPYENDGSNQILVWTGDRHRWYSNEYLWDGDSFQWVTIDEYGRPTPSLQ